MKHQAVMDYLGSALRRMRLQMMLVSPEDRLSSIDFGLRRLLGLEEEYSRMAQIFFRIMQPRTVYRLMDPFECCYIFFALPQDDDLRTVLIGPYLTADPSREAVLERTERLGLPLQYARQLEDFYAVLPVLEDTSMLMALISTLGETLWGGVDAFETVDLNRDIASPFRADHAAVEENRLLLEMKNIETRYAYENEMMDAVARGLYQRVERLTAHLSRLNFELRMADPLRNTKNYCIICNTLLRKSAERGGVHPLHVDRISSQYAVQIENKATVEGCIELIGEMFRTYCRLVRSRAAKRYSAPVQKALVYMEENLAGDLGLEKLAQVLGLTPGYLSGLFHREVGETLTRHITRLRMEHAMQLLKTTQLQVQNVAQLCGVPDANYFSKLFRRQYGVTPRQYRQTLPPV